jgi:hypothetical protein
MTEHLIPKITIIIPVDNVEPFMGILKFWSSKGFYDLKNKNFS